VAGVEEALAGGNHLLAVARIARALVLDWQQVGVLWLAMSKLWPAAQCQAEPLQCSGAPSRGQASDWNGVMFMGWIPSLHPS